MTRTTPLLLLIIIASLHLAAAQSPDLLFENFSIEQGLSNNSVRAFFQDSKGYLWIGTGDGLNLYDGISFKVFRNIPDDTLSLRSSTIQSIYEDHDANLWIGTNDGLHQFDYGTYTFRYVKDSPKRASFLKQDKTGKFWIGRREGGGGLGKFDTDSGKIIFYNDLEADSSNLSNVRDIVQSVIDDQFGNLWIATFGNGLYKYITSERKLINFGEESIKDTRLQSIYLDDIYLWVGTTSAGLSRLNIKTGEIKTYQFNGDDISSLSHNQVNSILKTTDGYLWIGTSKGLCLYNEREDNFTRFYNNPLNPQSLCFNTINKLFVDNGGIVWIGTAAGGISKLKTINEFANFTHYPYYINSLTGANVQSILVDGTSGYWIGTGHGANFIDSTGSIKQYNFIFPDVYSVPPISSFANYHDFLYMGTTNGLIKYNKKTKEVITYRNSLTDTTTLSDSNISALLIENNGTFWVGTFGGLNQFVSDRGKFLRYGLANGIEKRQTIYSFFKDASGSLWIGTSYYGLVLYNQEEDKFSTQLNNFEVISIEAGENGNLWLGTNKGLVNYRTKESGNRIYTIEDGLPSNSIRGLKKDLSGNLWITTSSGLSKLDLATLRFTNYGTDSGIPGLQFNSNAIALDHAGRILIGGLKGLTIFHPDSLKSNTHVPQLAITDFEIFGHSILSRPNKDVKSIADLFVRENEHQITLGYEANNFTIHFAALDFKAPSKNQYAYQMDGFDANWIQAGNRTYATFTNLDPGTYVFKVKGSNNDGIWNEEGTSLKVIILPPPWKTWWAYTLYSMAGIIILLLSRNEIVKRERLRNEFTMKKLEADKYQELDTLKSRFFANISHEFRTPLTLILGPIQKRLEKATTSEDRVELSIIQRNAQRLLVLVNQLLDLSRLESGNMSLRSSEDDLISFLKLITQNFHSMAEAKKIQYSFEPQAETVMIYYDPEKLEKIINNLLSNAFKFTPEGGKISVIVSLDIEPNKLFKEGSAEINVTDSGIGIASKHLEKIFDRFYQIDSSQTREYEGTGIGLALTRELVELHHGVISVSSTVDKGTTFSVKLPLGYAHLKPSEIQKSQPLKEIDDNDYQQDLLRENLEYSHEGMTHGETILIIEDNDDLRFYLGTNLSDQYSILEAVNGEEGFNIALDKIPDLVLSDLMMPKLDGVELCHRLKQDERTSHIPIVLLTAKADSETKIRGLEIGADDYIPKPFVIKELQARIQNLISNRKKLQEKFAQQMSVKPRSIVVASMDERFMQKILDIVEIHISNPAFGVEFFAREVGMSTAQLYRKIKALTSYSPNDFIRHIRLQRAADLIRQNAGNIAEIAYQVGFNSLSYFSKCFKDKFGILPSEFNKSEIGK